MLETAAAWLLGLVWALPLAYAVWTAFHPAQFSTHFVLRAPLTLENFAKAWDAAPFARYFVNTTLLVTMILAAQLVLCTLAAYAFARFSFRGREIAFLLVLVQLMIMPDVLIVENYRTMSRLGILDTLSAIGLPYMASAFGIFLLRQTFKAAHRDQLRELAAPDRGAPGLLVGRSGRGLVHHHRGHPHDLGSPARGLPALPAPVRPELHARGHPLSYDGTSSSRTPRPLRKSARASATRRRNSGWCSRR